jgi:hypothetical protein
MKPKPSRWTFHLLQNFGQTGHLSADFGKKSMNALFVRPLGR